MTQPIVLSHSYTRKRRAGQAAVRYYQLRPRGPGEPPRQIFTRDGTINRDGALRMVDERQHGRFLVHRLMLSPPEDIRPENMRELTRHVMRELEKEKGCELHWFAVEHRNTDHPHVHIVLCGGGGKGGKAQGVRLDRADHARIKEEGMVYCRTEARLRDDYDRALRGLNEEYPREAWDGRTDRDDHDR